MESKENEIDNIKKFSLELRKNILEMAFSAGASSSHLGGALSIVEIVAVLFSYKMKLNENPKGMKEIDLYYKGHACLAYYAALCEKGINKEDGATLRKMTVIF